MWLDDDLRHGARKAACRRRLEALGAESLLVAPRRKGYPGAMETAVREEFDWSLTRYHQVLNGLLDRPEAMAHAPMLIARLRRLREARATQRSARRGFDLHG